MTGDRRRALPAVGSLLELDAVRALLDQAPRDLVTDVVRSVIDDARHRLVDIPTDVDWVALITERLAQRRTPSLRPVINATGVVLHTNLGRAPLARQALDAMREVASGFSNLEYEIDAGVRGSRHRHCADLLCELTGADDAMVVNNCAAALVLALNTVADGRDAVISRGELVEIGGSFRVPDIMRKSGARLVEVGTTNRTHLDDYRRALSAASGAIVSVHRSNFAIEGFVASVSAAALAPLADETGVPLLHDFGSGLMLDLSAWGLSGELTARDAMHSRPALLMMSGDKLLGGPQAGIILGRASMIDALRRNPLARALRVDKLTLSALEATLTLYREPERAVREIPALAMLTASVDALAARAAGLASDLRARGIGAAIVEVDASVGGGAFPTARIPSIAIAIEGASASRVEARLREAPVPVVGRVANGRVLLDLRGVLPETDPFLIAAIEGALA